MPNTEFFRPKKLYCESDFESSLKQNKPGTSNQFFKPLSK